MSKYTAYIDTTILGNWILYYKKRDVIAKVGKRIITSFDMLNRIEQRCKSHSFLSSTWAVSELTGVIIDNMVAEQMLKDGISLTEFSSQKRVFNVQNKGIKRNIVENLAEFRDFLERYDISIRSFEVDDDSVTDLLLKHTFLPVPDALHLSFVIRSCDILVTLDERHFLDKKHRNEIQDANKIKILSPNELSKQMVNN